MAEISKINVDGKDYNIRDKVLDGKLTELNQKLPTNAQGEALGVWVGTEEEYNALESEADNVVYVLVADRTSVVKYRLEYSLTDCTSSNAAISIVEGMPFETRLTPNEGLSLTSVVVTMGGVDITSDVYADGVIAIPAVTGDINIVAVASEVVKIQPVMDGLGIWFDASENTEEKTYNEAATSWISKVECGDLGRYPLTLINVYFKEKRLIFSPLDAQSPYMCLGLYNPFSEGAIGAVGTGDFTLEVVVDSEFSVYNLAGDSVMFLGVNGYSTGDITFTGRWSYVLYDKTDKYLSVWCNDGSAGLGRSGYTPSSGKHTLTAVRKSGIMYFYDNGVQVGSAAFTKNLITERGTASANGRLGLHIGQQNNTSPGTYNNGFTGAMYDVKMYARALTTEEVVQNHQFNNQHYSLGL